jgi:predicted DNA-binding antitoxin AbrB/MazE fold protein
MTPAPSSKVIFAVASVIVLLFSLALALTKTRSRPGPPVSATSVARMEQLPRTILWAWERPSDLRFINPHETGVAFLARTIRLRSSEVAVRPRLQPLDLPEGSRVIAVARVESDSVKRPELSKQQSEKLAEALSEMALLPNVGSIQIDFDAKRSERDFYRDVILSVRRRLPETVALSITALASWCTYDDWLSDLPLDEAVPMLFRMGPDRLQVQHRLAAGEDFTAAACRHSYGISTDEPLRNLSSDRRLYVFNPAPWTESSVRAILESRK